MNNDEFEEYKTVIRGALDLVHFNERVDIQIQRINNMNDIILVSNTRGTMVWVEPNRHIFMIGHLSNLNEWTQTEIDLTNPDSLMAFGTLMKKYLGASWAT